MFNSFSASACFVLFEETFLFKLFSLWSKSVFFTKLVISFLLAKYACANLAGNFSAADLLNSGLVIHIVWSDILFSIAVRVLVAAKLLILGVLPLT